MDYRSNPTLIPERASLVARALEGSKKAGWPWDKAFAYAAAMLALEHPVPTLPRLEPDIAAEFPFWTAIDKHTQRGKEVIRQVAKTEWHCREYCALAIVLLRECTLARTCSKTPWWERERRWRLSKCGLSEDRAEAVWASLRPAVIDRLQEDANGLKERVTKFLESLSRPEPAFSGIANVQQELF